MAKIALLIGISEYDGEALTRLPGTQADLQAMQRVLQNPDVGAFEQVEVLQNPNRTQMELAIDTLFTDNRNRDDLILLYFSGHGVRDDSGDLYFAVSNTQKTEQGKIRTSTAVRASEVQRYMTQSRSKRQVLILDCCFSGAFARDMTAKDAEATVDVKTQLGGEGRAVLTSSTATQFSFEKQGASLYTTYLVQGLETGAADKDGDGQITVDELHEYAREKVQEAAPTMQPEIYAAREGYKIIIARAPQGDPKLKFRKEVDERVRKKRGKLSPAERRAFKYRWQELGLSAQEANQIIDETLQPYQAFWSKLTEFEECIQEMREHDPQLDTESLDSLRYLQRVLKLRDEDVSQLLKQYQIDLTASVNKVPAEAPKSPTPQAEAAPQATQDDLSSEKGIDYTRLRDLLKAGQWREADKETYEVMIRAVGKKSGEWFSSEELLNFPCTDLRTIDGLWVKYSQGKFGFSVQKQIYVECGAQLDGKYPGDKIFNEFCDRVGWRKGGKDRTYSDLKADLSLSPTGEFPDWGGGWFRGVSFWGGIWVFSRIETCKL
jgi:hypothetical protein